MGKCCNKYPKFMLEKRLMACSANGTKENRLIKRIIKLSNIIENKLKNWRRVFECLAFLVFFFGGSTIRNHLESVKNTQKMVKCSKIKWMSQCQKSCCEQQKFLFSWFFLFDKDFLFPLSCFVFVSPFCCGFVVIFFVFHEI